MNLLWADAGVCCRRSIHGIFERKVQTSSGWSYPFSWRGNSQGPSSLRHGTCQIDRLECVHVLRTNWDSEALVTFVVVPSESDFLFQVDDGKGQFLVQVDIGVLVASVDIDGNVAWIWMHSTGTKMTRDHKLGNTTHDVGGV